MMHNNLPWRMHLGVVSLLVLLALYLPVPLYLVTLALFGLPHVIWELAYLRSRYTTRWPLRWWIGIWIVLALQAAMRTGNWLGKTSSQVTQIGDLLSLILLAMIVLLAPMRVGMMVRAAGMAVALILFWLLQRGDIVLALFILAISHNFTPVLLAWDQAKDVPQMRSLAWVMTLIFLLPLGLVLNPWTMSLTPDAMLPFAKYFDSQAPAGLDGPLRQALLSAMVLAQCLHYYSVIIVLPHAEARQKHRPVLSRGMQLFATLVSVGLLVYFIQDFAGARQLYAVASGVHAWLEWPLLLMAMLSTRSPSLPAR